LVVGYSAASSIQSLWKGTSLDLHDGAGASFSIQ
jgi:hypothetical protein